MSVLASVGPVSRGDLKLIIQSGVEDRCKQEQVLDGLYREMSNKNDFFHVSLFLMFTFKVNMQYIKVASTKISLILFLHVIDPERRFTFY